MPGARSARTKAPSSTSTARTGRYRNRIYFGKDGDRLVILLAGGAKKRQDADIAAAKGHWRDYKRRKRQEVT